MAEAVVSIAGKIVSILGSQAIETVGKFWGVKHELKELRDTVSRLQPVLDHAEEQYHQTLHVRVWVEDLKDAFYEAHDVLEEFNIEAIRRELRGHNEMIKEVKTFFSSSNQLAFKLKMSNKVRAVRERIQAIKAEKKFHLNERPVDSHIEREWRKREETHSFIREGDIIGRDDDKKKVKDFLMDSNVKEDVSILPIVGIGGLGKTALAQCVYNDEMVSKQFNMKMWVCVSDNFDKKKIVKDMIACAKKIEPTGVTMDQLQSELRGEIDGKRYLLVLDDWWNEEQETWLSLKTLLVGGARGSKILITTRLPLVAKITSTTPHHLLRGLSESASLKLLMQMACCNEEEKKDPNMLAICKDIVTKCYGVPLVVRIIGSLLVKKSKHEWSQFKENELPDVSQREDGITLILKLSYDHLPSHLKRCFAFCSLFPKDFVMDKRTLVDLWMAEGFILPSNRRQHLEDIGHGYFMDLLWSNFFQDFKQDPDTKEETCKMHDLMHDLACMVAGTEYWVAWDDRKSVHERTRHISVGDLPISRLKACPPRTFLSTMPPQRSEVDLCQLMQSFKRLRILDLHCTYVEKVPRSICKLKHLTYLNLSHNTTLKRLPNSITRLQNLQTLNLSGCDSLEELPEGIRRLVSLRNLDIDGCKRLSCVPRGLRQLSSLHRLTRFILPKDKALAKNYCELGELNGLNDIRGRLCIENLGSVTDVAESTIANLIGKRFLESLALSRANFDADDAIIKVRDEALLNGLQPSSNLEELAIKGYKGERFPRWMLNNSLVSSLPNLVELRLWRCTRCKWLPQLGQLPRLRTLEIYGMSKLEFIESDHSFTSTTTSFPSLLRLVIHGCEKLKAMPRTPHLKELKLSKANLALINQLVGLNKLKTLDISFMYRLECLPEECLKSLTSLESLRIGYCPMLTSVSSLGMRHLSSLVDLSILNCAELDLSKEESGNIIILDGGLLHNLRSVIISCLPKLKYLPQWLLQASNLERLEISICDKLKELPEQIGDLQSLQWLDITRCPSLTSLPEGIRRLASLTYLDILDCPELRKRCKRDGGEDCFFFFFFSECDIYPVSWISIFGIARSWIYRKKKAATSSSSWMEAFFTVPQWLLQASNLERLEISDCNKLKELPEKIGDLQSLQVLDIGWCPSLASLPEGMRRLASLAYLCIVDCPVLTKRCKRAGGEDWYKIAHIPDIFVRQ
ncbi:putative disease resistance protein RGA1 [Rhodamnia argentea]|uniref:Disease resistance protein RGA1 n=1 Tax=Rhodamnia argentea TaxID=178133 RepID=A0ABM3HHK9_9MYRT|nr:putative disease resistance protein RGA1 [Rhodamnia argentea]